MAQHREMYAQMLSAPSRTFAAFQTYPYRERLPRALMWLCCVLVWAYVDHIRIRGDAGIALAALFLGFLCGKGSRPFWFFSGTGLGAILVAMLPAFSR